VERVIQIDRHEQPFVNYRYDCTLFSLKAENNALSWTWIAARRDPTKALAECLTHAPASWSRWVSQGALDSVRQQILSYRIRTEAEQLPSAGSREAEVIRELYSYYAGPMKHRFEAVAERIAQLVFASNGIYHLGWITRASGDRGIDFVGRLDLGTIAGQAKCQVAGVTPAALSRLAAKLGRGWVGVFVTTGYFSQQAQMELQDDGFPILLVDGAMVGELISRECLRSGLTVRELIASIDATYDERVTARSAAEILSDE
jgi:hypothetical protein